MSSPVPHLGWPGTPRARAGRLAGATVNRARLSVVPARRSRAPRVPFVTLVSVLLLTGVVGLLLFNTSMQQASFAATELEKQAATLSAREKTLQMDLDRLGDPQRIAEYAQRRGMVIPAAPGATLDLTTGRVRGERTVASPADGFRITPPPPTLPSQLRPRVVHVARPATRAPNGRDARGTVRPDAGRPDTGRHDPGGRR